ncbi:MAG: heparinase II/III family protein [Elusimicrobia bacterium]|nr:heparinase II/III family protein [Elusimicrobiota bacterium]
MLGQEQRYLKHGRQPWRLLALKAAKKIRLLAAREYLRALQKAGLTSWLSRSRLRWALLPQAREQAPKSLSPRWVFWPLNQKSELVALIHQEFPVHAGAIIGRAKEHLSGRYRLLEPHGRDLKKLSLELAERFHHVPTYLPWHYDWVHPHRWEPGRVYLDCDYESLDGIDVKLPWELSRMAHFVTLAQAHVLTGEREYADEIAAQFLDWCRHNPPGFGVNWACTMDVGLRAANVLSAISLLGDEWLNTQPRVNEMLMAFSYHHGAHILKNLELPTNHLLGDLTGLAYISVCYPYFQASQNWADFARQGLFRQLDLQVFHDGMDFEGSTSYHRLATEFFLASWLLMRDEKMPAAFGGRVKSMIRAIDVFMKSNGRTVQVGDNDSGRLWGFAPERPILDYSYLISLGALAFNDPNFFEGRDNDLAPEALWLLGPRAWVTWRQWLDSKKKSGEFQEIESRAVIARELSQGGLYSCAHYKRGHLLLVSNGRNGPHDRGGHAHNDRLSFHLTAYGEDIIVDPGTGVYLRDRSIRNELRSTGSHNTLIINDVEQNEFGGPFALEPHVKNPNAVAVNLDEKTSIWRFMGEHDGYLRLPGGFIHRRNFIFDPAGALLRLTLSDRVVVLHKNEGDEASLQWNFVLAPDISLGFAGAGKAVLITPRGRRYEISAPFPLEVADGLFSPEFGVFIKTIKLKAKIQTAIPTQFEIVIHELPGAN